VRSWGIERAAHLREVLHAPSAYSALTIHCKYIIPKLVAHGSPAFQARSRAEILGPFNAPQYRTQGPPGPRKGPCCMSTSA
jgi:hypothetical protein